MTHEGVFEVVKQVVLEVLPELDPGQIETGKSLKELGANSIDRMEVASLSMQALNLNLPLMSFAKVSNIGELVDTLANGGN